MLIGRPRDPLVSEITPPTAYAGRRAFLLGGAAATAGAAATLVGRRLHAGPPVSGGAGLPPYKAQGPFSTGEPKTPWKDVTTYNNFYELGLDKDDPAENAGKLRTRPWTVAFEGEIGKPQTLDIDTLLRRFPLEERIYRLRCVEAWSMVIPWVGFPLGALIKSLEPTSNARFVAFTTLMDPSQLPGQKADTLQWPYVEGLRMDEALHPLTILAVGLYGQVLPGQNGAPVRLVVPWKYGFKSAKSIVKIRFVDRKPPTSWSLSSPREYGFYANVNPEVDHPRWSQRKERRIGELFKRPTLAFNGYGGDVYGMYKGMDLSADF